MKQPRLKPEDIRLREVLFEIRQVGNLLRVTAIDPGSGTEVITIGDPQADRSTLERIAARKLKYVIAKRRNQQLLGN